MRGMKMANPGIKNQFNIDNFKKINYI